MESNLPDPLFLAIEAPSEVYKGDLRVGISSKEVEGRRGISSEKQIQIRLIRWKIYRFNPPIPSARILLVIPVRRKNVSSMQLEVSFFLPRAPVQNFLKEKRVSVFMEISSLEKKNLAKHLRIKSSPLFDSPQDFTDSGRERGE